MKRSVAVCLAGIFIYSFLFQSLHIVHHHGYRVPGQVCEQVTPRAAQEAQAGYTAADPDRGPCLICDFKFPINELPVDYEPGFIAHRYVELGPVVVFSFLPDTGYSRINPRAPPAIA